MRPTMAPASTVKETRSSATTPPKRTLSSRTSSSDISGQVYKRTSPRGYYAVGPGASGGSDGHADASGSAVGSKGAGGGGTSAGGVAGTGGEGCGATGPMSGRALRWTPDADGRTGVRSPRISTQYARAASSASKAMIGRKTSGGFVITSSPLGPPLTVNVSGEALGLGLPLGDADAVGEGEGDAGPGGVGVGGPCRVKLAHGYGCTLTHRRCRPGVSPGKGFMGSYARNPEPLTVIVVFGPPAAKSRTMLAPMGIGVGDGVGCGVGVGEGVGDTFGEGVTVLGVVVGPRLLTAVSTNHAGKMTRTLSALT